MNSEQTPEESSDLERARFGATVAEGETPPELAYIYRVAVALRPDLEMILNQARQSADLPIAPPGVFALGPDFFADDLAAVIEVVRDWAAEYLPLELCLERVAVEVIGAQRYIAGYSLAPEDPLMDAQAELTRALSPYSQPLVGEDTLLFVPRLPVSDYTPVADFPRLIHAMQANFAPLEWHIGAVEVLRVPEGDDRWEVVEKIAAIS